MAQNFKAVNWCVLEPCEPRIFATPATHEKAPLKGAISLCLDKAELSGDHVLEVISNMAVPLEKHPSLGNQAIRIEVTDFIGMEENRQ